MRNYAKLIYISILSKIQVIPGDPLSALARSANGLQSTDLLVIAADQDTQSLANAWFYVPRMLHDKSLVLLEDVSGSQPLSTKRRAEWIADDHGLPAQEWRGQVEGFRQISPRQVCLEKHRGPDRPAPGRAGRFRAPPAGHRGRTRPLKKCS